MRAGKLWRWLDRQVLSVMARGAARLTRGKVRLRGWTVAAMLAVSTALAAALWAADRPATDHSGGDVLRVGVAQGESIPDYLRASRERLAELVAAPDRKASETYALVAFSAYLAPDRLASTLDGVSVVEVFSRVPMPGTQTEIVRIPALRLPDDVVAGMGEVAERKEAEARDYRERHAALGTGAEERELRHVYDSGARVAAAEAEAYRSRCSCLYAAVVRATPARLDELAGREDVRAVDPAPELRRLDRAVFLPPLPEQRDVARPPDDTDLGAASAPSRARPSTSAAAPTPGSSIADPVSHAQ